MNDTNQTAATGPKEHVLRALQSATGPLDSYELAKLSGATPTQVGRTLAKLAAKGIAVTDDPLATENDLSARYRLVEGRGVGTAPAG